MLTCVTPPQAEEERGDMEKVKLDNKRILFNLLPAHVAQHFLMSNPRNMVSVCRQRRGKSVLCPQGGSHALITGTPELQVLEQFDSNRFKL